MKATGIVRRIDELGRVVIPKEIRRNYGIKEGDSLEIFTTNEGIMIAPIKPDPNVHEEWAAHVIAKYRQSLSAFTCVGNTVTAIAKDGVVGVAVCSTEDTFSINVGLAVAIAKIWTTEQFAAPDGLF